MVRRQRYDSATLKSLTKRLNSDLMKGVVVGASIGLIIGALLGVAIVKIHRMKYKELYNSTREK